MVLSAIERERADVLKTFGVNSLLVVVLYSEFLPNDDVRATFNQKRYGAASEIAALWANVERCSTMGKVRRTISQEPANACFLLLNVEPAERRNEIGIE